MNPDELARLFDSPAEAGRRAQAARAAHFGRRVRVRAAPAHPTPAIAAVVRGPGPVLLDLATWPKGPGPDDRAQGEGLLRHGDSTMADAPGPLGKVSEDMPEATGTKEPVAEVSPSGDPGWPAPAALRAGDRLIVQVDRARLGAYLDYLVRLAAGAPDELGFAPVCARPGGLFRLHLIAAARVALPGRVRVEARHDLLGIRLAQVALGFGADTLAGPLAAQRRLPLAGVPRPDEASPAGLAALVERAGLEPVLYDLPPETLP